MRNSGMKGLLTEGYTDSILEMVYNKNIVCKKWADRNPFQYNVCVAADVSEIEEPQGTHKIRLCNVTDAILW